MWPVSFPGKEVRRLTSATVVIDLDQTPEEVWKQTKSGHRNEINRARKQGYVCEVDEAFDRYSEFIEIYRASMRSMQASNYYNFNDDYFEELRHNLGNRLSLAIATLGGELAAASLFMTEGAWIQYHLSATHPDHRKMAPSKLIIDTVRMLGAEGPQKWLHLGGGRGGDKDSLLDFKGGFSTQRLEFNASGIILDTTAYQELSADSKSATTNYFPAYRDPI